MKKIFMLFLMVFALVSCGEKFPYTSKGEKIKLLNEYSKSFEKFLSSGDDKYVDEASETLEEIFKITSELEKRSWNGDEKAIKELQEWESLINDMDVSF